MDLKKILSKWHRYARKTLFTAEAVDGELKRVKCNVYVNSDDVATLDNAIDRMVKFRESIRTRYNV